MNVVLIITLALVATLWLARMRDAVKETRSALTDRSTREAAKLDLAKREQEARDAAGF